MCYIVSIVKHSAHWFALCCSPSAYNSVFSDCTNWLCDKSGWSSLAADCSAIKVWQCLKRLSPKLMHVQLTTCINILASVGYLFSTFISDRASIQLGWAAQACAYGLSLVLVCQLVLESSLTWRKSKDFKITEQKCRVTDAETNSVRLLVWTRK